MQFEVFPGLGKQEPILFSDPEAIADYQATKGAEKSPDQLFQEQDEGRSSFRLITWKKSPPDALVHAAKKQMCRLADFCPQGNQIALREVASVPMIVMPPTPGELFWREYRNYLFEEGKLIPKDRKYPFPAVAIRNEEIPLETLFRGLREEFGIAGEEQTSQIVWLCGADIPIITVKPSRTAGFMTLYIFYPAKFLLRSDADLKSMLSTSGHYYPSDQIPPGEVWRIDGADPGKILCFRQEPFPSDWRERLSNI